MKTERSHHELLSSPETSPEKKRVMSLIRVQDVSVEDIYEREKPRKHYVYSIRVYWQDGIITPIYRSYNNVLEFQKTLLRIDNFIQNQEEDGNLSVLLKGKKIGPRFNAAGKRTKALKRMPAVEEFLKAVVHLPPPISESDPVISFFRPLLEDLTESDLVHNQQRHRLSRRGTRHKCIHHISEPIMVEQYVVIADYIQREDSDISLKAGNVVDVVEKSEHGWWFVDLDGVVGWAPASYLKPKDGIEEDQVLEVFEKGEEETYITLATYEPQFEDEVKLEIGMVAMVMQKNLDGWWFVKIGETEGWAPSVFLREVVTSRHNGREKRKDAVRVMLRDYTVNITGRKKTWVPPKRKKTVKRDITAGEARSPKKSSGVDELRDDIGKQTPYHGTNKVENLHDVVGRPSIKSTLPAIEEERQDPQKNSRGTSPIGSPLLRRDTNSIPLNAACPDNDENRCNRTSYSHSNSKHDSEGKEIDDIICGERKENESKEYKKDLFRQLHRKRFFAMGSYKKEDTGEVNLHENAEVEVIKQSACGWWLVRTASSSVGWAPSNFLDGVNILERSSQGTNGDELLNESDVLEVIPIQPDIILKMGHEMCLEREFVRYIPKGDDTDTCPLDPPEKTQP